MKTIKLILVFAVSALISQSCRKGSVWGIYGKGSDITRTYALTGFSSIRLDCDANVYYVQDSVYSVQVSGQENIISIMEVKVVDNQLKLDFLREVRSHNEIRITVHCPAMTGMSIDGSGNITSLGTVQSDNIGLYINGSGNITIPTLKSNSIDSKIAGSGDITLNAGTGKTAYHVISGSGNIYSVGMQCQSVTIRISGTGNASVYATDDLSVNISGSGDVRYKGKPTIDSKIDGSGSLIHI